MTTPDIDTSNKFMLSAIGSDLMFMRPPAPGQRISKEEALVLSAYLRLMVMATPEEIEAAYAAVASA